jgi:HEAT repeat protein
LALPFLIEIRSYLRAKARVQTIVEYLETNTPFKLLLAEGELSELLDKRDAVVMFDGLDEILDPDQRLSTIDEIREFASDHRTARVIVTTRAIGYADSQNPERFRFFRQFTLQQFDKKQINEFIHNWYSAAIPPRQDIVPRLQRLLETTPALRRFAANPLLLTLIAELNTDGTFPLTRITLYRSAVRLLVRDWDVARHLRTIEVISADDKLAILQKVALEMLQRGTARNVIARKDLISIVSRALEGLRVPNLSVATDRLIEQLAERNFIILPVGDAQYSFLHSTLADYFSASELANRLNDGFDEQAILQICAEKWQDELWSGVLPLFCSLIDSRLAAKVVRDLFRHRDEENGWRAVFLAADCLFEAGDAHGTSSEMEQVRDALEGLVSFEFPYPYELSDPERRIAAEVREGAVMRVARAWQDSRCRDWLRGYAGQTDQTVKETAIRELARAWPDDETRQWLLRQPYPFEQSIGIRELARTWPTAETRKHIEELVLKENELHPRLAALQVLVSTWPDERTCAFLEGIVKKDKDVVVQREALHALAANWPDDITKDTLVKYARGSEVNLRTAAVWELAPTWRGDDVEALLDERANTDEDPFIRGYAVRGLAKGWREDRRRWLLERAEGNTDASQRAAAVRAIAEIWADHDAFKVLSKLASSDSDPTVRSEAVRGLGTVWPREAKSLLAFYAKEDDDSRVRMAAIQLLGRTSRDEGTRQILLDRSERDENALVRRMATKALAVAWRDDSTRRFLLVRAVRDGEGDVRETAVRGLARSWRDDETRQLLIDRVQNDPNSFARGTCEIALRRGWPNDSVVCDILSEVAKNRKRFLPPPPPPPKENTGDEENLS